MEINNQINWKKYFYAFVITAIIFATAIYLSNYFEQKKIDDIRTIQDKISIDILSSETQFSLLEESSCADLGGQSALSDELGSLEDKLTYTERDRGVNDPEVQTLKQYYSLLEIKDYILMQKIAEKCGKSPLTIIYFYSTDNSCADCEREGYVLTDLRTQFPDLRVYSFDYNLDISAVKTLIAISKVENDLPAVFIKDKMYYGFQSESDIEKIMPELLATSTATTTQKVIK
jgi:hypothetical protein